MAIFLKKKSFLCPGPLNHVVQHGTFLRNIGNCLLLFCRENIDWEMYKMCLQIWGSTYMTSFYIMHQNIPEIKIAESPRGIRLVDTLSIEYVS